MENKDFRNLIDEQPFVSVITKSVLSVENDSGEIVIIQPYTVLFIEEDLSEDIMHGVLVTSNQQINFMIKKEDYLNCKYVDEISETYKFEYMKILYGKFLYILEDIQVKDSIEFNYQIPKYSTIEVIIIWDENKKQILCKDINQKFILIEIDELLPFCQKSLILNSEDLPVQEYILNGMKYRTLLPLPTLDTTKYIPVDMKIEIKEYRRDLKLYMVVYFDIDNIAQYHFVSGKHLLSQIVESIVE